jgi:hypothetical protein
VWFDRGLVWCALFPGVSYAAGPNYNKQWKAFDPIDLRRTNLF